MFDITQPMVAPTAAERAKTISARSQSAALISTAASDPHTRIVPVMHHVQASGQVSVLLPNHHTLISGEAGNSSGTTAVVELVDLAPVPLREPIRGLLWITGRLHVLPEKLARTRALAIAETNPNPRLLDLGHGLRLVEITPASLVLADAEGTHPLRPHQFGAATVDPFWAYETDWLRHLASAHRGILHSFAKYLPDELREGRIQPLGLDRCGLRLRIEGDAIDHDVRLRFSQSVDNPHQLAAELRRLEGIAHSCPCAKPSTSPRFPA